MSIKELRDKRYKAVPRLVFRPCYSDSTGPYRVENQLRVLLNYSEQIALFTITDFNFMALFFVYKVIYNKINNNDNISIMNGFVAA